MSKFTTIPLLKNIWTRFKNTAIFELWVQVSFGARLLSDAVCSLILTTDKTLDFHAKILTLPPVGIVENLKSGWNIKQLCNQLPSKYFSP